MKHNFTAGPAVFPKEVLEELSTGIINFEGTELSILEVSHRGKEFQSVLEGSFSLLSDILGYNSDYQPLFLYGGATVMFSLLPMNLLYGGAKAGFINSGVWSQKAIKAAKYYGNVEVLASSEKDNFSYIAKDYVEPDDLKYFHITSNNTIYGSQWANYPRTKSPLVVDMSSDILSRTFDVNNFGCIYAAAQKNLGPAGTTLVIIHKDLLAQCDKNIPEIFSLQKNIDNGSLLNTPPVFSIYGCYATLKWIKKNGLENIENANRAKASLFYNELDRNQGFRGVITAKEDRSMMNATFQATSTEVETRFNQLCKANGIVGIEGHRLAGGYRASMYNALPIDSVKLLVELMKDAEQAL